MKLTELVNRIVKNYFIIFGSIVMTITILRQVFYPDTVFDLKSIYMIMAFSLIGALTGFILYSHHNISERNIRIRIAIHFCALELTLISLGYLLGIVESAASLILLAVEIAAIYVIVRLLSWQNDKRAAKKINEKLLALKEDI
ncbi:DUF3021 family protein [Paenibacillus sp. CECT 9249]|uniref:DUF3021 family protein n=1 Tax=unclassified Paenibacillus TaxID=185978 RepID=UPI001C105939|nr:DUF3021 family protein [Paenibacillus sp. CECT 9249]MBU5441075.1 DUF3021 domain-containing protein [Paenibacillus sp. MSJ-34]CAH0119717.1 hypothetical protein PAE9249_02224 [Paenibacillus sp. CECT 9249]